MRSILLSCLAVLVGCGGSATSYVHTDTTLGRVVVYRNGVAYFERYANVVGDQLRLAVPADKVDDFLKSLTVVDAVTGEPAPVAYPTNGPAEGGGLLDMNIHLTGNVPHRVKLSYVTEAPSWKPSYRVTLGKDGKVGVQAWAIVDNTSGEDWKQVKLGVGSSSAMSFRFDLRSVRVVQRETLRSEDLFAFAPPQGESTYDNARDGTKAVGKKLVDVSDAAIAAIDRPMPLAPAGDTQLYASSYGAGSIGANAAQPKPARHGRASVPSAATAAAPPPPQVRDDALARTVNTLRSSKGPVLVEGYASGSDEDKYSASLERANRVRAQLVNAGLDPSRIVAVGKGEAPGHASGVSIVEAPAEAKPKDGPAKGATDPSAQDEPIGTSHFESTTAMTVPRGSSAMVSILRDDTDGEVVYLYDAETARGNATYPFRAVRIKNPSDSALESGPVTVFGDGKFVGEGMCEPIPARATAFVPFALDRQIVVEHKDAEHDEIARILTVQRGVLSTEVQHSRKQTITLHNRMSEKATVYLRHTVAAGYKLGKAPAVAERMGNANLFRVDLPPNAKIDVDIEESTPVFKTTDLRTPEGLEMVKVFVSSPAAEGPLKAAVAELLQLNRDMADVQQHIETTHEQMQEYRARMDELHAQILTLKMVRTAGPLMQSLERKMQEMSDKLSKATIDVVAFEESLMVSRVHFQDKVADLTLEKPAADAVPSAKAKK